MWNIILASAAFLSFICIATPTQAAEPALPDAHVSRLLNLDSPGRIPGRYIVQFKPEERMDTSPLHAEKFVSSPNLRPVDGATTRLLAQELSSVFDGKVTRVFEKRRKGFAVSGLSEDAARSLADDPRVDYVEPVIRLQFSDVQGSPGQPAPQHLDRIDQRALPRDGTYTYAATGNGVTVFVLDSGIRYTHDEFQDRAGTGVWDCVVPTGFSQDCGRRISFSSPNADQRNPDCNGHGTRVASVIGGRTFGVAKGVELRGYIITNSANNDLSCSSPGDTEDMKSAIEAMEDEAQDDSTTIVVNLSVIVNGTSNAVEDAIRAAMNDGAVFVVGAGNDNIDACTRTPTRMSEVITVAAVNEADTRWGLSNYGSCVDLFAPGTNITAADRTSNSATISGREGTSYAAPIVSGIVALYLQTHPQASAAQVQEAIKDQATTAAVISPGANTANRLAYSLVQGGTGGGTGEPPSNFQRTLSIILHLLLTE
jgi:subtilisin family serine protease